MNDIGVLVHGEQKLRFYVVELNNPFQRLENMHSDQLRLDLTEMIKEHPNSEFYLVLPDTPYASGKVFKELVWVRDNIYNKLKHTPYRAFNLVIKTPSVDDFIKELDTDHRFKYPI